MNQGRTLGTWAFAALLTSWCAAPSALAQSSLSLSSVRTSPQFPRSLLSNSSLGSTLVHQVSADASSDYLRRLANAVTFIQAGSSADYSEPFKHLILNVGAGLGYQAGYAGFEDVLAGRASPDRLGAFSAQATLSLGLRFGEEDRSRFFASFASSDYSHGSFKVDNWGWGLLWQYDVVRASRGASPLLSWNGLRIGSGFRWNRLSSSFTRRIGPLSASLDVPGYGELSASLDASLETAGEVRVMSVPLEVGTSVRWMSVLSVYGVAGADAHFGSSEGSLVVSGPVSAEARPSALEGETLSASAEGRYAVLKSESPDTFSVRGLLGLQFELGRGSVFLQYQKSSLEGAEAAALGFRAYF